MCVIIDTIGKNIEKEAFEKARDVLAYLSQIQTYR